jgi:putative transposase
VDTYHRGSVRGKESTMGRKHTHYSSEFRAEAVRLAGTSGQSVRQVALDLGISNQTLGEWIRRSRERPPGTPLDPDERAELDELRRRVRILETEREILRKSSRLLRSGDRADPVTRFCFVEQAKARYPVRILCSALGVSHARSRGTYGVPRIWADLADAGFHVSRKRVARLMRRDHLTGVHRRRVVRTTIRDEDAEPFPDLVDRDCSAPGPTGSGSPTSPSCRRGAAPATSPRSSTPGADGSSAGRWPPTCGPSSSRPPSTRFYTRRDKTVLRRLVEPAQYTSLAFGRRLRESGIAASMGPVGDCFDNPMAESFFATPETELIDRSGWAGPAEAKAAVFEYIEVFYNRIRRHSSLGSLSPEQFETRYRSSPAVAAG